MKSPESRAATTDGPFELRYVEVVALNEILDPPNLLCAVLICALPTVSRSFIMALSMIDAFVKFINNDVLATAVGGEVGGVKAPV